MHAHYNNFFSKKDRGLCLALIFENLLLSCWERCQLMSPASWSNHMLPIKPEGHIAGQQLNLMIAAWCVFRNGTLLQQGGLPERANARCSVLSCTANACVQLLPYLHSAPALAVKIQGQLSDLLHVKNRNLFSEIG